MKNLWLLILTSMVLSVAVPSGAANISYAPDDFTISGSPGETILLSAQVSADKLSGLLFMELRSVDNELPNDWVYAAKVRLSPSRRTSQVPIMVTIPRMAPPGEYSGRLESNVLNAPRGESINSSGGIYINLTVNNVCVSPPMLKDIVVGPQSILIPNGKETTIQVSGTLVIAEGCSLQAFTYDLDDEYSEYSSSGPVSVGEGGSFFLEIPVEASRYGQDKDGRLYSGTLIATGVEAGGTKATFSVTVEHDRGQGKNQNIDK